MNNDLQKVTKDIAQFKKAISHDIALLKKALLQGKTVLNPKEAAEYIGISQSTLYKLTSAGILPFSKPNGKLIYFSKAELDRWLLSNSTKSSEQKEAEAATYITKQ